MADIQDIQDYYEGSVEPIYRSVFGTNLHLAMFDGDESRDEAHQKTKDFLVSRLPEVTPKTIIYDLGSGYGDMPRYLTQRLGCRVVGLNLVHVQNVLGLQLSREAGLADKNFAVGADFGQVPFPANSTEIVWSQEAMLHAPDRRQVVEEAARLLQPGGVFLFTDILQTGPMEEEESRLIRERVRITPLDSFESYRRYITEAGLDIVEVSDLSHYVARYYDDHAQQIRDHRETLIKAVAPEFVDYTVTAMGRWVKAAEERKLGWGMFLCRKP